MTDSLRILLVEDNPGDVRLTTLLLEEALTPSPTCVAAQSLNTAMGLLDEQSFDVMFLDLGLPDSRGVETVNTVLNHDPSLAVIVLTGLEDDEVTSSALSRGAQDYLIKGEFDARLLKRVVHHAIERASLMRRIKDESIRDPFTGLLNRRGFETIAQKQISLAERERMNVGVFYMDLDNLKLVNDREGHDAGDRYILAASHALSSAVRAHDVVCRLGGDEFVALVLFNDASPYEFIRSRVLDTLQAQTSISSVTPAVSTGWSVFAGPDDNFQDHISRADEEMYREKQAKKLP